LEGTQDLAKKRIETFKKRGLLGKRVLEGKEKKKKSQ